MTLARAQNNGQNAVSNRLEALKKRHSAISRELEEEHKHPAATDFDIRRLKIEKLKIKDEIQGISRTH